MTSLAKLGMAAGGAAAVAVGGVWIWRTVRGWGRKSPDEVERLRRMTVNACGRIIPARIIELIEPNQGGPSGPILFYQYEVAGVTYEAAQDMSAMPEIAAAAPFLPGQTATVKCDPKQPTNSILACELWSGIPDLEPKSKGPAKEAPPEKAVT